MKALGLRRVLRAPQQVHVRADLVVVDLVVGQCVRQCGRVVLLVDDCVQLGRRARLRRHGALRLGLRMTGGLSEKKGRLIAAMRNALDVAVHPDSPEGQALMAWLRTRGVSFLAFRGPIAGEATGAQPAAVRPAGRVERLRHRGVRARERHLRGHRPAARDVHPRAPVR